MQHETGGEKKPFFPEVNRFQRYEKRVNLATQNLFEKEKKQNAVRRSSEERFLLY